MTNDNLERRVEEIADNEGLVHALREIAETSVDADSVRMAYAALVLSPSGRNDLAINPPQV